MIESNVKMSGRLNVVLRDKDGKLKDHREVDNLVVTDGLEFIAGRMTGTTPAIMSHMALGSGSTAAAAGDTSLGSELGRVALTDDAVSGSAITYTATFGAGTATGAVTEAGIFNNSTGGDLLCRTVFSTVNKAADDSLAVTWTVTISAS